MAQPWEQDWSKPATAKADDNAAPPWERNWSAPPTKPEDTGNVGRGFKEAFQQVPQLGYGLLAGTGAAIESAFGEGGIGTGLKKAGVKGYTEWGDKIAAGSKESDSFDYSWGRAKEGDIGALGAWIAHGLGYAGGQAVQMLATAGLGAVAGKATLGTVAKSLAEGMVQKEAAALAATDAAKALSAEQITKLATQAVASKLGQTAAIGASAFGMEGGEIFGDLAQEADKEGRTLTGEQLAKAFGATLAAGGLEFVGDKIGLDVMLGKSRLLKPAEGMAGLGGRAARAGIAAAGAAPIEGATEYAQTLLEEAGKGHDPLSAESLKQAKDAAALGALGGAAMGGVGGAIQGAKPKATASDVLAADSIDDAANKALLAISGPTKKAEWEVVDGALALPGPAAQQQPEVLKALPGPDGQPVFMADDKGNVAVQPAAARVEALNREFDAQQAADAAATDAMSLGKQAPVGLRPSEQPAPAVPVGEATEVPFIPTGDATEVGRIPTGEASEVLPTGEATEVPRKIATGKASEPDAGLVETIHADDLLTTGGVPYGTELSANVRARKEGLTRDHVVEIPGAGWVIRPNLSVRSQPPQAPINAQPNNTRGTTAADVIQGPRDANRTDVGGNPGRGAADGGAGTGVGSVVQGKQPEARADGVAPGVGNGADERAGAVRTGPGRGNDALKAGAVFTLDGKQWTVQEVKDSAIAVRDAENNTRMVARNSKTFQKITAALQPAATAPEPATAEIHLASQGAPADEVKTNNQKSSVQTVAGALAPAAQNSVQQAPATAQEPPKAEKPQPTEATHADPGEKPEAVTPAVVSQSLTTAAKNEDRKPSAMKADLLAQIDRAAQSAPDAAIPVWKEPTKTQLREVMVRNNLRDLERARKMMENAHHNRVDEESKRIGFITFNVPGDGVFKVLNTQAHLSEFRKKVEASQGFKDKPAKPSAPDRDGSEKGSGSKVAAFDNMVNEGDLEAASDYANAVGLELDPKKIANATKVLKWREQRDAAKPVEPETASQPEAGAAPALAAAPDALVLTPKQYHDARLRKMAGETGVPLVEVREAYDTDGGRAESNRLWGEAVDKAVKAGATLSRQTLDKLLELNPTARLPESAIPAGYQRPEARKQEADAKDAIRQDRREAKEAREPAPAEAATTILDAAGVTGKERLDALKDVKAGTVTPEELAAAYPAKQEAAPTEQQPAAQADSAKVRPATPQESGPAPMPAIASIPMSLAQQAHAGTSFVPERRAEQERDSFKAVLQDAWERAARVAGNDPAAIARITEVFQDVADGYRARYVATLQAKSRVMSAMIAGPARFPTERNRKRIETEMKRAEEASAYLDRGIKRLLRAARGPIDNSPASELERVRLNLSQREEQQETMKAANAALRKGDDAALEDLGFTPEQIAGLKKGDFAGRKGFPDYQLTNNNAEIRRLRERLKDAEARVAAAEAGPVESERQGVRIVEDATDDRIRLIFDGKPSEEVRNDLKAAAFKWSPKNEAWQRQLTPNAKRAAQDIIDKHFPPEKARPAAEEVAEAKDSELTQEAIDRAALSTDETAALEAEYGAKNGTEPFHARLAQDVSDYITRGAEAIGSAIRSIVGKVAKAVLSFAVVVNLAGLNPHFSSDSYARAVPAMPRTVTVTQTVQFKQEGKADTNGRTLSPSAAKVVNWIGAQNRPSEVSLILDPAVGRLYVMRGGKIEADAPALYGKQGVAAITDRILNAGVDETTDDMKVTPAGVYPANMVADHEYGSRIDFLNGPNAAYAIHRVYLGDAKERRLQRLASTNPADHGISFGCVNVSNEFYDKTLRKLNYKGDAYAYLLPSDVGQLDALVPMPKPLQRTETQTRTKDGGRLEAEPAPDNGDPLMLGRRRADQRSARGRREEGEGATNGTQSGAANDERRTAERVLPRGFDARAEQSDGGGVGSGGPTAGALGESRNGGRDSGLGGRQNGRVEVDGSVPEQEAGLGEAPKFSRSGRTGRGISITDAEAIAADIRATMPTAPQIVVVESVGQLPDKLRNLIEQAGADNDVEGVYWGGKVYAVTSHFSDLDRFRFVVAHHELRHHGFGAMLGPRLHRMMMQIYRSNAKVRALADQNIRDGIAKDVVVATEEALADMPVEDLVKLRGWQRIVAAVREFLRNLSMKLEKRHPKLADMLRPEGWTDEDIARLISRAEDMSRTGEPDYVRGGAVFAQAWHGTPHRGIERFSTDKIGTGEGNQAYGWGLYFASKREIADHYRETLTNRDMQGYANAHLNAKNLVARVNGDEEWATETLTDQLRNTDPSDPNYKRLADTLEMVKSGAYAKPLENPGQLYEVNVPEDSELLLWDKPLSEQPAKVREALREAIEKMDSENAAAARKKGDALLGHYAYSLLQTSDNVGGARGASELLASLGVKGIKYLDGLSRDGSKADNGHNYVIFSGDDVQIERALFSRARPNVTPATAPSAMVEALQSFGDTKLPGDYIISDFIQSHGKLSWWDKTVGSMHNLAQRNPLFKPVYDRAQDFLNAVSTFATESADLAPTLLPKLEGLRDLGKSPLSAEDTKAISAPIFEGTLLWTRDENGQIVREEDPQKAGVVWRDDELRSRYKLNDHQIKLYREFRAATNKSLTDMTIADMIRFGGADVLAVRDRAMALGDVTAAGDLLAEHLTRMADEDSDRAGVLIDTAGRIMGKAEQAVNLMSRGYAPLTRFGHYTLDVTDAEGQRVYFGLFESQAEANRFARKMRAAYPDGTIQQGTLSQEAYKMFAGISPETAELFGQMLGLEAQGDDAASQAFQEYLKLAKSNRSAMKRLIERKGIAGFSEDAGRVLAGFVYSNARQAATNLHMGAMNDAVQAIAKAKGKGELLDTAVRLHQYIANPVEEAQKIKGLMFTQFLGGSFAAGLVNLSQVPMVTFPYLSQFGGAAKAAMNLKRGLSDALKWETAKTDAERTTGDAGLDLALKRAEEDGIVSPQEIHSLIAQANGAGALKAGDGTKAGNLAAKGSNFLSKLGLVWGKPFAIAEQFNRRATFIAAYRTAVEQGMRNPAQFAEQAVTETQFSYTKANRPEWARGALGSVLFTFKTYSISYVELLYRMAKSGPEGKKAALLALGVMFLMAGMQGLPGADDLDDLIDGIMQRLGYNFSSKQAKREFFAKLMGEGGAQFMMRGVSGLPGAPIDVANRLGLGNLIPGTGLLTKKTDHTSDVLEIGGPALSFGKQLLTGADQLTQGNMGKAVESVLPVAAANAWKAIDMASSGMYRDQLGRKVIDTDGYDALVKAIGFQPNTVAKVQDASRQVQTFISLNKMREGEIADQWAQAIFDNDAAGKQSAREALDQWNRDNPESPIKITTAQLLKRLKAMREDKMTRIEHTAPKEIRATVHRELADAR